MPSTRKTGLGGYIEVYDTDTNAYLGRQDNEEYEIDIDAVIDEATDSASTGWADGEPVLGKVNSITINCIDKSDAYPELVGLTAGARINLILKHGSAVTSDEVTGTIVRNVRKRNPQQGLRRIVITCEYGEYSGNV